MKTSNQVTVHAGSTKAGPVIGRATVVPTGATAGTWAVDARDSNVSPNVATCAGGTGTCVTVESTRGGLTTATVQRVR